MAIFSIYYRHHTFYKDMERTVKEAITKLQYGEDYGELHSCGVIDTDLKKAFIPICLIKQGDIKEFNENKKELIECIKEECDIDISRFVFKEYPAFPQS